MVIFGQKYLYLGISGGIRAKGVVFEQKWLFRARWLYSRKCGYNWAKWLYSGNKICFCAKVVLFGQEWLYSGKGGCIRAKLLFSVKVVVFGRKWLYSGKVVVFE